MSTVQDKLAHISACAQLWEDFGVSRIRAITRTVEEIKMQLAEEHQVRHEKVLDEMDTIARSERT